MSYPINFWTELLTKAIIHKMIHNTQQPMNGTLLSGVIRKGMADFVAELVMR